MFSKEENQRYHRHLILPEIGVTGQAKLKNARVLMIGAGGLGCPVLQYLAAAGVGSIGIVDNDRVDISNLQRQILYTTTDVGLYKAEVAAKRLQALNNAISITPHVVRLTSSNVLDLFAKYDLIIDGTDNFETRYLINDACVMLNKPFVFGSIYKFDGQVSVFNYENGPTYRCLYPEAPKAGEVPNCAEIGVLGVLPGIIGCLQANEALKIILQKGDILSGKLLLVDALTMQFTTLKIKRNDAVANIEALGNYDFYCEVPNNVASVSAAWLSTELEIDTDLYLLDVREVHEHEYDNIGGINIPLAELENNLSRLSEDKTIVVYCQTGARSLQAAELLTQHGFSHIKHLEKGLVGYYG